MIQFKRGTSSQWTSNNPTLSAGQPGVEFDNTQDITKIKIGDGSSTYSNLPYISANPVINQTSGTGFDDMEISGFYDMLSVPNTKRPSDSTSYKSFIFGDGSREGYVSQFAIGTDSTNGSLFYRTNNTSLSFLFATAGFNSRSTSGKTCGFIHRKITLHFSESAAMEPHDAHPASAKRCIFSGWGLYMQI